MQSTDIPGKSARVFAGAASGAYIRPIPQTTADPAAASYDIGFPPQTFTDEGAGGTPPDGRDVNGIFAALSAWTRWLSAGGPITYDGTFQTGIGGYPKGARIQSATNPPRIWLSTAENNLTNPDTGGAGWVSETNVTYQDFTNAGSGNVTVPSWATHAEVQVVGGGGGGGGANSTSSGGGGGAGGYGWGVISVTPLAVMTYAVGGGGSGGAVGLNGGNGGNSTFGGITATGGFGGSLGSRAAGGGGGGASGAPRNFSGGDGGDGNTTSVSVQGGNGSPGPFGGAGRTGNPLGISGHAPGAGGGGGWGVVSATGGAGAGGAVLIRWLP